MENLTEIFLEVHKKLDELFLRHQEALVSFKLDETIEFFDLYCSSLFAHMRDEEELLLPIYEERYKDKNPGGELLLFKREHDKIRQHISEIKHQYMLLREKQENNLKRAVISLIEQHLLYKRLMEHHDTRERNFLYPSLDQITSPDDKAAILKQCLILPDNIKY